jgi:hypothetical protein
VDAVTKASQQRHHPTSVRDGRTGGRPLQRLGQILARLSAGNRRSLAALRATLSLWLSMTAGLLVLQALAGHDAGGVWTVVTAESAVALGLCLIVGVAWLLGL